ncbi:hypothetical protein AB0M35_06305 [Micromonospora sp. NPDC051196]|uniref:hypothetical protein n=1 Tax=Micromonospora sp. NPDC051196 TaxID=3155281 RepID=UPI00343ADF70
MRLRSPAVVALGVAVTVLSACGPSVPRADPRSTPPPAVDADAAASGAATEQGGQADPQASTEPSASASAVPSATPTGGVRKSSGDAVAVPAAGRAVDTSRPTRTVGTGTRPVAPRRRWSGRWRPAASSPSTAAPIR